MGKSPFLMGKSTISMAFVDIPWNQPFWRGQLPRSPLRPWSPKVPRRRRRRPRDPRDARRGAWVLDGHGGPGMAWKSLFFVADLSRKWECQHGYGSKFLRQLGPQMWMSILNINHPIIGLPTFDPYPHLFGNWKRGKNYMARLWNWRIRWACFRWDLNLWVLWWSINGLFNHHL